MKKPTNRKPKRIGALTLKEIRSGGKYVVEVTWRDPPALRKDGSDGRRHFRFENWRAAEIFAEKRNAELEAAAGRSVHTFADLADDWERLQEARATGKTQAIRLRSHKRKLRHVVMARAKFSKVPLHQINTIDLEEWLVIDLAAGYGAPTRGAIRGTLRRMFVHARKKGWLLEVPDFDEIKIRGSSGRKRADVPQRSDIDKLREAVTGVIPRPANMPRQTWDSTRIAVAIAATCGLRIGEVCGLTWDRIDRDTGVITVKDVVEDGGLKPFPKGGEDSIRLVPTNAALRALLDQYADTYRKRFGGKLVGHLVRSDRVRSDGRNPNPGFVRTTTLDANFAKLMAKAGLPKRDAAGEVVMSKTGRFPLPKFTFHALRAYFAADRVVETGGDYELVAKWGGWTDTNVLVRNYSYLLTNPNERERFEQMDSWLTPPLELTSDGRPIDGQALPAVNALVALPAPAPECPIEVPEYAERWLKVFVYELWRSGGNMRHALAPTGKTGTQVRYELRRCRLPTVDELRASFSATGEVEPVEPAALPPPAAPCPIDIPDGAADWLPAYIRALDSGGPDGNGVLHQVACRMIHKDPPVVRAELRRLKLPEPRELRSRLRRKKAIDLRDRGFQDVDAAAKLGLKDRHTVQRYRRELLKTAGGKSLKGKRNSQVTPVGRVGSEHDRQGKLL
jgi:integrase